MGETDDGRPDVARLADMPVHGWGDAAARTGLPAGAARFLRRRIGTDLAPREPVPLASARLREPALHEGARTALTALVGSENVRDDRTTRLVHAGGKSYPDLMRRRLGDGADAPDAVVLPRTRDEVAGVLGICAEHGVAVVPFGGGTSVVGGVEPVRGRFAAVIALDLRRLDRVVAVDPVSRTATLQAGLRGPAAEQALARHGLTLGHFPQSFEYATVGGWIATRSAGQASTGYGRSDDLVVGLRAATPAGELVLGHGVPASAAGPDLRELIVGSEGVLGVLTEVTLRVRPVPATRRYEGWSFRSFADGAKALRDLVQSHATPDVARLSDTDETEVALAQSGGVARGYLRLRGHRAGGCLVICGWEGEDDVVRHRRAATRARLRRAGGTPLGARPGDSWERGRVHGPYLRDELMDVSVMAETLETATSWSNLHTLRAAVREALRTALTARGTPPLVLCHISHLYETGASLYFTWLARQERGAELEQWRAAKTAASEAIMATGGTITHHHAVGTDHRQYMGAEVGALGLALLRAAKKTLDPEGILNPGKLLPGAPSES